VDAPATAREMALVLAHPVRIGDARYRLGKNPLREVDATAPFRRLRRDLFKRVGTLREQLTPNQDDESTTPASGPAGP